MYVGLGKNKEEDYLTGSKVIYLTGMAGGEYGFYRSDDGGKNWLRINNENQMYGQILAICGDSRKFGRFYIATGTRGLLYGEPDNDEE